MGELDAYVDALLTKYENAVWAVARAEFRGDNETHEAVSDAKRAEQLATLAELRERVARAITGEDGDA